MEAIRAVSARAHQSRLIKCLEGAVTEIQQSGKLLHQHLPLQTWTWAYLILPVGCRFENQEPPGGIEIADPFETG